MSKFIHTLSTAIIAFIVTLIAIFSMPIYKIYPRGIVLPEFGIKSPIKSKINFYDHLTVPFNAENIGLLSLMYYSPVHDAKTQQIFLRSAQKLVNNAGGNALQVIQAFYVPPGQASGGVNILRAKVLFNPIGNS